MTNPGLSNSAPKPRNFRRVKALYNAFSQNPAAMQSLGLGRQTSDQPEQPMVHREPEQPPMTLSGAVQEHRVANPVRTKASLVLDRYPENVGTAEYDTEKANQLKKLSKANALGEGLAALFNVYAQSKGADIAYRENTTAPFVIDQLQQLDNNYLDEMRRLRDVGLENQMANVDIRNREAIARFNADRQDDRIADERRFDAKKLQEARDYERELMQYKSEEQLKQDAYEMGINPEEDRNWKDSLAEAKARANQADVRYKSALINQMQRKTQSAATDELTQKELQTLDYLNNKVESLRQQLNDPENFAQTESIQSEIDYYQDILKNPRKATLAAFTKDAQQYANEQVQAQAQEYFNILFDKVQSEGITPDNLEAAANIFEYLGYSESEAKKLAKAELEKVAGSSSSEEITSARTGEPLKNTNGSVDSAEKQLNKKVEDVAARYNIGIQNATLSEAIQILIDQAMRSSNQNLMNEVSQLSLQNSQIESMKRDLNTSNQKL